MGQKAEFPWHIANLPVTFDMKYRPIQSLQGESAYSLVFMNMVARLRLFFKSLQKCLQLEKATNGPNYEKETVKWKRTNLSKFLHTEIDQLC